MNKILVVEDDRSLRHIIKEALNNSGLNIELAVDGVKALEKIKNSDYHLVITDLMMPGMNGLELMEKTKDIKPETGFLIMTAYGTVQTAVDALKKGAFDFITKPFSIPEMESNIERFFEFQDLKQENKNLRIQLSTDAKYRKIIGKSKEMEEIFQLVGVVASSDAPVFIQGESGTGKELLAESIHENSIRNKKPFLKINCSAIPESLVESTYFGHEKGAFTNAVKQHKGLFEEAHGGTLLLDEISEIPMAMQAKLLRVLQEGTINRVGSTKEKKVDVRVIATSNRNILSEIKEGNFREDLFYRLNVFPLKVPALRNRTGDVPLLVEHFILKFQEKYRFEKKTVQTDVLKTLSSHPWPGNVRQLENLMERAILFSGEEKVLVMDHFNLDSENDMLEDNKQLDLAPMTIAEVEKQLIFSTLKRTRDNRTQAADILGISVRTLRNKLHQYEKSGDTPFIVGDGN
tara:strand:+ start:6215 stop:7597 length:1383 start_codon:yes stop_codon:yes gene_type:complete